LRKRDAVGAVSKKKPPRAACAGNLIESNEYILRPNGAGGKLIKVSHSKETLEAELKEVKAKLAGPK